LNAATIAKTDVSENRPFEMGNSAVSSRAREFVVVLHVGFLLIGVVTTLLGPILPTLAIKWSLDDAELGFFFMAQFSGAIIGSALSSWLIVRIGLLRLMVGGYAAMAVAVACLGVDAWLVGLLSIFVVGVALGLTAPATNLLIAQINPERPAAAVNVLNFAWALGAVTGPPIIAFLARDGHLAQALIGLAVMFGGVTFLIARRPLINSLLGQCYQVQDENDGVRFGSSVLRDWLSPYALFTGGLIFIYLGTEISISGWIATYALRLGESSSGFETLTPSVFWAGLLMGRATAAGILIRIKDTTLILFSLLVAGFGLLLILVSSNLLSVTCGGALAGLGLAAVFPTTFAIFARFFAERASQMTGALFVIGGLGGALLPWLVGFVSQRFGDLRVGIFIPLLGVAGMIVLQLCIIRVLAQRSQ
jgi:fucose permease